MLDVEDWRLPPPKAPCGPSESECVHGLNREGLETCGYRMGSRLRHVCMCNRERQRCRLRSNAFATFQTPSNA